MSSEEMRRRRKLYLMSHTKSSMAFDELGEVRDPIATICKWANENLEDGEIRRLQAALGRLVEQAKDDDGLRALDVPGYSEGGPTFAERSGRMNSGAQAADSALVYASDDESYEALFEDAKRLGEERPIFAKPVERWS